MRARNRKTRLIAGAFLITTVAWVFDMLTAAEIPQTADAADRVSTATPARMVDPPDRASLEQFLFQDRSYGEFMVRSATGRNPFARDVPAGESNHTIAAASGDSVSTDLRDPTGSPPAERPPFEARHRLGGVVLGKRSIALIDDRPYSLGEVIDEMTILEIRRDYIILGGPQGELRIDVPRAGEIRPDQGRSGADSMP